MPRFQITTQENQTFLSAILEENEILNNSAKQILTQNDLPGVAELFFSQRNDVQTIRYEITSKMSMDNYFNHMMTRKNILAIIKSMVETVLSADDYLLSADRFLLEPEYVFIENNTYEASLIYLPINGIEPRGDLRSCILQLLMSVCYDDADDNAYIAHIITLLNSRDEQQPYEELLRYLNQPAKQSHTAGMHQTPEQRPSSYPADALRVNSDGYIMPAADPIPAVQPVPTADPLPAELPPVEEPEDKPRKKHFLFGGKSKKEDKKKDSKKADKKNKKNKSVPDDNGPIAIGIDIPGQSNAASVRATEDVVSAGKRNKPEVVLDVDADTNKLSAPRKGLFGRRKKEQHAEPQAAENQNDWVQFVNEHHGNAGNVSQQPEAARVPYQMPIANPISQVQTPAQAGGNAPHAFEMDVNPMSVVFHHDNNGDDNKTIILGGEDFSGKTIQMGSGGNSQDGLPQIATVSRRRTGDRKMIAGSDFYIGTDASFVDFYVSDNARIGQKHVRIMAGNDQYMIEDLNSMNHTYLNGVQLESGRSYVLHNADVIRLADEDFVFQLQ